jgi:hypothetical protein
LEWIAAGAVSYSQGSFALEGAYREPLLLGAQIHPLQTPNPHSLHPVAQGNFEGH